MADTTVFTVDALIANDAQLLSRQLHRLRQKLFPPEAKKELRRFSSGEAAKLLGVSDSYLRQLSLAGEGPTPGVGPGGRRQYTLSQINVDLVHRQAGTLLAVLQEPNVEARATARAVVARPAGPATPPALAELI